MKKRKPSIIQKPWAVYCEDLFPVGIGLIVEDRGSVVNILYCECQQYPPECWDSHFVRRFDTSEQAIKFYLERRDDYTEEGLIRLIKRDFPKASAQR